MKLSRPSPALVVAIVALVIACAGTATAASVIISNSSQVRANSLNGSDIKNGSLRGADFKAGTISGTQLSNNSVSTEDLAPSVRNTLRGEGLTATEAIRRAGPDKQPPGRATVATLKDLAPGTYLIMAKSTISPETSDQGVLTELLKSNKTTGGECVLDAAGDQDHGRVTITAPFTITPDTINLQMTRSIATAGNVVLSCTIKDITWKANDTSIVAMKLSGSTRLDTTG